MSALVGYDSSDAEEDDVLHDNVQKDGTLNRGADSASTSKTSPNSPSNAAGPSNGPFIAQGTSNGTVLGPAMGPSLAIGSEDSAPSSPYSRSRAAIRALTLPSNPNLDIPPSPPGSPPPGTDAKFTHFLDLKRQGIHFNAKLASSAALKNPSLLPKLMQSAGVTEDAQFATTLSTELWDPAGFPQYAFKEELAKSQQAVGKRLETERSKGQRENVDFVLAAGTGQPNSGGIPPSRGLKGSAAERVMAGLNRDKDVSRSPKRRKRSRSR